MPSPPSIESVYRRAVINPSGSSGLPAIGRTTEKVEKIATVEGAKGSGTAPTPRNPTVPLEYDSAIAGQRRSIWSKYVTVAEKLDRKMMEKWKSSMNNLLIFAALFTAIVTSFVLDAMSDLDEDTGTKLLRILVEQSTANQAIDLPPSNPPPSILAVNTLWLLSIMSSLAATTWAILCLEWCAFLTEGAQAEDYEIMAERRQRRFEAVKRWRMHMVVVSIPFFLHISLFLFLAGLWLRLRDMNQQLGLIVGIPGLIIATSYAIATLLPIFTEAPFFTAVTEMVQPLVNRVKRLDRLRRFVYAPLIFSWISDSSSRISKNFRRRSNFPSCRRLFRPFRIATYLFITSLKYIYRLAGPPARATRTIITLLPVVPAFKPGGNPFKELNRLQIGRSNRDKGIHQRALFWLMSTPLTRSEVKEVLEEFWDLGKIEGPLDRSIVKLLVLSLSSVLEDGHISEDEQPIFDHCTTILAEEMDRAFGDAEYDAGILFRNSAISSELEPHFKFGLSDSQLENQDGASEEYWKRVVTSLWFSPSAKRIEQVVEQLESNVKLIKPTLLQRVVRALHATMLTSLRTSPSILDFPLPEFNRWGFWEDGSPNEHLDKELSAFLQNLFAEFYRFSSPQNRDNPTTIPSLIVGCLTFLDDPSRPFIPPEFHSALCFFIVVLWRSNPDVFDSGPSIARALVVSATKHSQHAKALAVRLLAIAFGPKHLASRQNTDLENISNFYGGLPDLVRGDPECIKGFLHANAATLETVLHVDGQFGAWIRRLGPDHRGAQHVVSSSLFTNDAISNFVRENPYYRLPYLYSLAIALLHGVRENVPKPSELFELLVAPRQDLSEDRILDSNALVVATLRLALPRQFQPRTTESKSKGHSPDHGQIAQTLKLTQQIIDKAESPWRLRWKAIYLLADVVYILPRLGIDTGENKQLEANIDKACAAVKKYIAKQGPGGTRERVPPDWEMKQDALIECGLAEEIKDLAARYEANEGVYMWRRSSAGYIPYLALYPQQAPTDPTSQAPYRFLKKLQRFVREEGVVSPDSESEVEVNWDQSPV